MNAPDFDHGYLRVPLSVWREVYCQAPLTRRQLQIVSAILRESWGWQTRGGEVRLWTRPLSSPQLAQLTGLSTDHLAQDLQALVEQEVLRQEEQRYQFVPDPRLWKTPDAEAPKSRPPARKCPAQGAKTALRPLASKTGKKDYKNVPPSRENHLSPVGDNSHTERVRTDEPGTARRHSVEHAERAGIADRLARLIETFVGPLPPAEALALRDWIKAEGVVPVWDSLEPVFRQGRGATRAYLLKLLTAPAARPPQGDARTPEKVKHA